MMKRFTRCAAPAMSPRSQVSLGAVVLALAPMTASAQEAPATTEAAQTQAPAAMDPATTAPVTAPEDEALGDIVVTAQRRSESILRTPIAITAVTGEGLRQSGTDNALRLGNLVPNLQIQRSVGLQISIRGISNENSLESGDPSAAFNVDGVYIARQQAQGSAFFDLERVEVLRGPQGTLYGRNATGGAVNLIPNKPTNEFAASVGGEIGNYGTFRSNGMINVPVSDFLSLRASFATNKRDSYLIAGPATRNGVNAKLGSDQDDVSARLQALFTFAPGITFRISADGSNNSALPPMQIPLNQYFKGNGGGDPTFVGGTWRSGDSRELRTVNWDPAFTGQNRERDRGILGEFNADLGFANLTVLGSHRFHGYFKREPVYFLGLGQANRAQPFSAKQDSIEVRLASTGSGPLKWVVGAFRFDEETRINTQFLPPLPGPLVSPPYNYRFFDNDAKADSTAAFGQATLSLSDAFRVTAGLRYTMDNKSRTGFNTRQITATYNPATDVRQLNDVDVSYSKLNWKGGVEYDVMPGALIYASVSTGYKAGGYNDGCLASTPGCNQVVAPSVLTYRPENLTAYEGGIKGRFFDNTLQATLSGFYYDYKDMQLQGLDNQTALAVSRNAAKSTIYGAELEGQWAVTPADRVNFSASWLHARYGDYQINATTNWSGRTLDRSPNYSLTLGYAHTQELAHGGSVVAGFNSRLNGASVLSNFSSALQYRQPSYTRTDATLTYNAPDARWYIQAFVNNLEDKVRAQGAVLGATFITDPRTYGGRFSVKF